MIRIFDVVLSVFGLVLLSPVIFSLFLFCLFDTGAPIFRQLRVGRHKEPFFVIKFRTMHVDTVSMPSHLNDRRTITKVGNYLRRFKLDELPQLWNVFVGEMSLVGPRPCLSSQHELIALRDSYHVYMVRPGISGLSQIEGIDMSVPSLLAETDAKMLQDLSVHEYFRYIFLTLRGKGQGDRVKRS